MFVRYCSLVSRILNSSAVPAYLAKRNDLVHEWLDKFWHLVLEVRELRPVKVELLNTVKLASFTLPTETTLESSKDALLRIP